MRDLPSEVHDYKELHDMRTRVLKGKRKPEESPAPEALPQAKTGSDPGDTSTQQGKDSRTVAVVDEAAKGDGADSGVGLRVRLEHEHGIRFRRPELIEQSSDDAIVEWIADLLARAVVKRLGEEAKNRRRVKRRERSKVSRERAGRNRVWMEIQRTAAVIKKGV